MCYHLFQNRGFLQRQSSGYKSIDETLLIEKVELIKGLTSAFRQADGIKLPIISKLLSENKQKQIEELLYLFAKLYHNFMRWEGVLWQSCSSC